MKKIFILTGEPSGDKLAFKVINDLKKINQNIEYLSVGGDNLQSLGIKSIYELKSEAYNLLSKDWGNAIGVTFILFCVSIAASMVPYKN